MRRILKGAELPVIHPLVDLNNCLSALLGVPCCVMKEGSFAPPLSFRPGEEGESYESMRGPAETLTAEQAEQELARLVEAAPVARILTTGTSSP